MDKEMFSLRKPGSWAEMRIFSRWPQLRHILAGIFIFFLIFVPSTQAQTWQGKELVRASLIADSSVVVPGKSFRVGLYLQILPGWHTYWENPGDVGLPTAIQWQFPPGFKAGAFQWPVPNRMTLAGDIVDYGYEKDVLLITEIRPPPHLNAKEIVLQGDATWLVCAEICVPGEAKVSLTLPVGASTVPANTGIFERFDRRLPAFAPTFPVTISQFAGGMEISAQPGKDIKSLSFYPLPATNQKVGKITESRRPGQETWTIRVPVVGGVKGILVTEAQEGTRKGYQLNEGGPSSVPKFKLGHTTAAVSSLTLLPAILYGFLGGLILNLMPCVFPVISLKIFGFIRQAGEKPQVIFRHGLAFAAGVFAWFFILAVVVVFLQHQGQTANWAFQFQNPAFNFIIIAVVFVFALNLLGVFEIILSGSATTGLSQLSERQGLLGSFLHGGFATLLATPCTAPFLGAALGFAFSQSGVMVFLIFASVALGLALPYLLLSAQTGWIRFLPRPGVWMERVKQLMAFPLLATVVWLLMVLGSQRGLFAVIGTLAFLLCLGFCCWMIGSFVQMGSSRWRSRFVILISLIIAFFGALFAWPEVTGMNRAQAAGIPWKPYSEAAVNEALAAGKPVFVDFTADWCLSCKFNEKTAIERPAVIAAFHSQGVVPFKADWTNKDPAISVALKAFGRAGVPFYLFYPAGKGDAPIILPELLTESIVLKALKTL